jgi:TolB protein
MPLARAVFTSLVLALTILVGGGPAAMAQTRVYVSPGSLTPFPVAAPDFTGLTPEAQDYGRQVTEVIRSNLARSGLFRIIPRDAHIQRDVDINITPEFPDWRVLQAEALLVGQTTVLPDGRLRVEFRLWDVAQENNIDSLQMASTPDNWRRMAHRIADRIYEKMTGEPGYFDSRIVFLSESGPRTQRRMRLTIMDQDGANPSFLTQGEHLVLSPRFSPTSQLITYVSYETGRPRVFLYNLETNRREVLGDFPNMAYAPRFAPDGRSVILTQDLDGNQEIFRLDLGSRQRTRLTTSPAIDTSPSYSPDGTQIVFNSDRGGSPQLYVMNADGSGVRRLTFGEGAYTAPVWSPRGDMIAFVRRSGGQFGIGTIAPDGTGEQMLTGAYKDESPTWSPNGRVIMFTRYPGPGAGPRLMSVDIAFKRIQEVRTPTDASDPAWSPLLP